MVKLKQLERGYIFVCMLPHQEWRNESVKDEKNQSVNENSKDQQLEHFRSGHNGEAMTTNQGLRVSEDEHSLKAGTRGPTLMEDFHFREK